MHIREITIPPNKQKLILQIGPNGQLTTNINHQINSTPPQPFKVELGPINSINLTKQRKFQDMLRTNPSLLIPTQQLTKEQQVRKIKCNCKKTKCIKLYCDCYANMVSCGPECVCFSCENTQKNAKKNQIARQQTGYRRAVVLEEKRCRCIKSNCLKKYCECFNKKVKCTALCGCERCENKEETSLVKIEQDPIKYEQ